MASSSSGRRRSENLDMSPETARKLFDNGGVLTFLNLPVGSVFGIDMKVFVVGEKFKGIKMIPPGLHFIYYSAVGKDGAVAPRTGFFHYFEKQEIVLKKWDVDQEEISEQRISDEEVQRIKTNLQNLDPYLGAYPYQVLKSWNRLTCNINKSLIEKLQPETGVINSVTQLIPQSFPPSLEPAENIESTSKRSYQSLEDKLLPNMKQIPGTEIRFTKIPEMKYPHGSTAQEITRHSMDSTYTLEQLLQTYDKEDDILGELQMALVCFLIGHVYEAFEHWKELLQVLCSVDSGLCKYTNLLTTFLTLLHYQIKEIPTDFYVDITSNSNFLIQTLQTLFENVKNSSNERFCKFVADFQKNLTKTYKWDFESIPDDELPVIVDM